VVFPRWSGDVTDTLAAAASGSLSDHNAPNFSGDAAVCVVLAAPGYPENPKTGERIEGLDNAQAVAEARVYAAGVGAEPGPEGGAHLVTGGGRVLDVVGLGPDLGAARRVAYGVAGMVSWPGMVSRSDIAASVS
jgi:phosphoribosylamine---glycine ligase